MATNALPADLPIDLLEEIDRVCARYAAAVRAPLVGEWRVEFVGAGEKVLKAWFHQGPHRPSELHALDQLARS